MCYNADGVNEHVFYDVSDVADYSPEKLEKYKHYAGISTESHEEKILQDLKEHASKAK